MTREFNSLSESEVISRSCAPGDGPYLSRCIVIEDLEDGELYTTASATATRFTTGSQKFRSIQNCLSRMISDARVQADDSIRGKKAYYGLTIKSIQTDRARWKGQLGINLLHLLFQARKNARATASSPHLKQIIQKLNKITVPNLLALVEALVKDQPLPLADELRGLSPVDLDQIGGELGGDRGLLKLAESLDADIFEEEELQSRPAPAALVRAPTESPSPASGAQEGGAAQPGEPGSDEKSAPLPPRTGFSSGRRRWLFAALVFGCIISTFAVTFLADPGKIVDMIDTEGPQAALKYARLAVHSKTQGLTFYLGRAYAHYRAGDNQTAERMAFEILSDEKATPGLRGDSYHLLGLLRYRNGSYHEAIAWLEGAGQLLLPEAQHMKLHNVTLALARSQIRLGNYPAAQLSLQQALDHYDRSRVPGKSLNLWWRTAFWAAISIGDINHAIELAKMDAESLPPEKKTERAAAFSNLGFAYLAAGNLGQGAWYTDRADDLIFELKDERFRIHNKVNWLILQHCYGQDTRYLEDQITAWADQNGDFELRFNAEQAIRLRPCGKEAL